MGSKCPAADRAQSRRAVSRFVDTRTVPAPYRSVLTLKSLQFHAERKSLVGLSLSRPVHSYFLSASLALRRRFFAHSAKFLSTFPTASPATHRTPHSGRCGGRAIWPPCTETA